MSEPIKIEQLSQLIANAQSASIELDSYSEASKLAQRQERTARDNAKAAWNSVYACLCEIAKEMKDDESFRDSKLGDLLLKGNRKMTPINE